MCKGGLEACHAHWTVGHAYGPGAQDLSSALVLRCGGGLVRVKANTSLRDVNPGIARQLTDQTTETQSLAF